MYDIESMAVDHNDPATILDRAERDASGDDSGSQDRLNLPADGIFDWLSIQAIANFAAANPARWRTIALKISEPGLSQAQIAVRLGITQQTVSRHLRRLNIMGSEF